MTELEREQLKLNGFLEKFGELIEKEEELLDDITPLYREDPLHYTHIYNDIKGRLVTLSKAIKNPFFGRIIFDVEGEDLTHDIYIGRVGIQDENGKAITVDWRAPITSLYYDSELGRTSYEVLDKKIYGELKLKRQFDIENGIINNFYDVDIVSNDKLLQSYLGVNNDKRLKNIVATIQREQNEIVRQPISKNIIVQGVAGCGKTTVALHRIAYLAYNYRKTIKPSQYMVIGPNKVFIDYIKTVLPDLDVNDVLQQTFEEFAQSYINEPIEVVNQKNKTNTNIYKFKNSLMYKEMLDLYLKDYIDSIVCKDVCIKDFKIVDKEKIREIFNQYLENTNVLENVVNKCIEALCNYIEDNSTQIKSRIGDMAYNEIQSATTKKEKDQIREKYQHLRKEFEKKKRAYVKQAFQKTKRTSLQLYMDFIKNIDKYNIYGFENISLLKKETLATLKDKKVEFEDLSSLMYISKKTNNNNFSQFRHVVIDEAQDLGEFNYYMLKEILNNATFSIYGDLAQSIYDYRSINNWNEVNNIFDNNCQQINLNKSYRTTDEIMKAADLVLEQLNMQTSEDVIRHGENVSLNQVDAEFIPEYIKEKIIEYQEKGYKSIAVISKNDMLTKYINGDLYIEGIYSNLLTSQSSDYNLNTGVVTVSNNLSKGLEFDAVIINDCSEDNYNSSDELDMKLLYVAMTRALHELDIVYSKELTKPLQKLLEKNKQFVKK